MIVPMNISPISNVITDTTRSAVPGSVKKTNPAESTVMVIAMRNQARPTSGFIMIHQVAGDITAPLCPLERRHDFFADFSQKEGTARMERATGWQLQETRHVGTPQLDSLFVTSRIRVRFGDSGQQYLGVWMLRMAYDLPRRTHFYQATQIHHTNASLPGEIFC